MKEFNQLKVLYEDNHLIAVNKPAGWLVQGDATGDLPLSEYVKKYIKKRYKKPGDVFLGVIHRLDRPVSGVVIFARTSKGLDRMNKLFREREIEKKYWAITTQRPNPLEGRLEHYLLKDTEKNITKAYDKLGRRTADAKKATLTYKMVGEIGGHHILEVKLITGRSHQIRVQLSKIGCPIRGDIKYGDGYRRDFKGTSTICLHCRSLSFIHPVKQVPIVISANPPKEQLWRQFSDILV